MRHLPRRPSDRAGRGWDELYGEYHEQEHGEPPSEPLRAAFAAVHDEVADAAP